MTGDMRIEGLSVFYGRATAVQDASFVVPAGRVTAVVGPNGAGKSSLALGVYGSVTAQGKVSLGDDDLSGLAPIARARAGLAIVPQGRQLFPRLSVRDNLQVMAELLDLRRDAVEAALDRFPVLRERENRLAGVLSGGEQQMLVVSRALMGEPRALILDEMMTGLAPKIVAALVEAIRRIADDGASVLILDPALGPLQSLVDRGHVLLRAELSGPYDDAASLDDAYQRAMGVIHEEIEEAE